MKLTIGIKALNEEANIGRCLASAVAAAAPFGGQVILADSGSTDRTIEIARGYPVRIVQLANPSERCCGAGAQLAFQYADGDFFYLLDGDMVLHPDFVTAAMAYLEAHPDVAAVGGEVTECDTAAAEFQMRADALKKQRHRQAGFVDRLDGGGLYRVEAIQQVGYFADRNLHAFEEFDLAARLQRRGWRLARIAEPAVDHYGYTVGDAALLWYRLSSGYVSGVGEILRGAIGKRHFTVVLSKLTHIRRSAAVVGWWIAVVAALVFSIPAGLLLLVAPMIALSAQKRSFRLGLYSFALWNASAVGLLSGLLRPRTAPTSPLGSVEISSLAKAD